MRGKADNSADWSRSFGLWLVALALVLRVAVPSGWMPAANAGFSITLCSGAGTIELSIDAQGNVHKKAPEPKTDHPCVFTQLSQDLTPGGTLAMGPALILSVAVVIPALMIGGAIGRGLAAPPPPPTGPPATF
jgi:ABC-type dipeptide/oligopeptide/nickel transport system permease subunit